MKKLHYVIGLILVSLLMWGCERPQPVVPEEPETPQVDFVLEVSDVTSTSCHFSVLPADETMSYVVMLVEKSEFDEFEDEYKYQDNDLEWFRRKATEEEKTLEEWLEGFLHVGPFESDEAGLMPGESYYLYAYGLDYEGYFTTGITKKEFSTPDVEMKDVNFDLKVTDIGMTEATVSVTASEKDALFFVNVFSIEQYEEWGGDESAFANHAAALVDYYIRMGQTLESIVNNLAWTGSMQMVIGDLTDDTEYIAYAIGIDENFFINSKAETVTFRTKKPTQSSNTFKVDIVETTYCSVIGTVTPSNDDPFVCVVQAKSQFAEYESDSDIMYDIVAAFQDRDMLEDIIYAGETVDLDAISSLSPDTEYVVLCFGWDEAPTTALTKVDIRTAAAGGNPRGQEFTFSMSDLLHNKVTVNITPKLGLHYFYDCMPLSLYEEYVVSEGSVDEAICRFIDERIDYGAEFFTCTRAEYLEEVGAAIGKQKWTFTDLEEDTEYMIVAATVNIVTGQVTPRLGYSSDVFRTTILIESNASIEFITGKYYDGTELAELDPAQFGRCKGMAMVPYTIVPNAEAAHWRTTFAYGDFKSWADRDDVIFELDYKCDNDKLQGFAVVHYDQLVSFLGIAEDENGYTGPFVIHEFKAVQGGASPAQEFIDSM